MRIETILTAIVAAHLVSTSLQAQVDVPLTVDASMDIYQAGGYQDGSGGLAPVHFQFATRGWQTVTFPSVTGSWTCQTPYPNYGPDGETSGYCLTAGHPTDFAAIGPFSGYKTTDFVGAMVGMFLEDTLPASPPEALRFYSIDNSDGGIQTDFTALSPKIGQVFFIGDGLTGTGAGTLQRFKVPREATRLYLGYIDNCMSPGNTTPGCFGDNAGSVSATVRLQDYVADWVEPTVSSAPSARIGPAIANDPAMKAVLLYGGSSAFIPGTDYGDTWVWSNNDWTQLHPVTSPPARGSAGIAYDRSTATVVLFGGVNNANDGSVVGDTWTWDGITWTQQFPPVSPPARSARGAMAWDSNTGTVLLFGGGGADDGDYGGVPFGDTWEWNGRTKTWAEVFPVVSPSPRQGLIANDELENRIVLFGGDNGGGDCCRIYYNDTWTWDGVTWTQQSPALSPPARTDAGIAYYSDLGQVLIFGGTSGPPDALNDTWGWNGVTWSELTLPNRPAARYVTSMAFDPSHEGLLLFGGELDGDNVTNQTWLLVPVPLP